jgi:hypothetical protein
MNVFTTSHNDIHKSVVISSPGLHIALHIYWLLTKHIGFFFFERNYQMLKLWTYIIHRNLSLADC